MTKLIILQGPQAGRQFPLQAEASIIGRQQDSTVQLESLSVSRQHARVVQRGGNCFVEDAGSSNGTFLNGQRVAGSMLITERDSLQIGPYVLGLRRDQPLPELEPDPIISAQV